MQPQLSVCIIMKNEEKVIDRCLNSISGIADEIIVVDTGSEDKSKEIALQYTDKVYEFEWVNDFSKARNYAASKAKGEWILALDADEYVDRSSFDKFKKDLSENPPDFNIIAVQIVSFVGQQGQNTSLNYHARLYKNDGNIAYHRKVHEVLAHNDASKAKNGIIKFQLYHSGYLTNNIIEKGKSKRNLDLLLNNENKEAIDYFFIGNEYKSLDDYNKAVNYYLKAYKLKPDLNLDWVKKLFLYLSDSLNQSNRTKDALEVIEACEEVYNNVVDFKYYKGVIFLKNKQYMQAKKIFEKILQEKENLITDSSNDFLEFLPLKHLGELYEKENKLHEAVTSYSRALSINEFDDALWGKLITLLADHSSLEDLTNFLNDNMLNKSSMNPLRVVKILLSVPRLKVQKLSRSFVNNQELSNNEQVALFIKNMHLDGDDIQISELLSKKSGQEIISLLATGIFSIVDFIILTMQTNSHEFKDLLYNIKYDRPLTNLYNQIFKKKNVKLTSPEEGFFISIFKQVKVVEDEEILKDLIRKKNLLSRETKEKLNFC